MTQFSAALNLEKIDDLLTPATVVERHPSTNVAMSSVTTGRRNIHRILNNLDDRLLVMIGPCSIHDPEAAIVYAKKLVVLREKYKDNLEIVMRVYFEKPRTTIGWKGLINDPFLEHSYKINDGLQIARKLLIAINNMGLPTGGEYLDLITPQYIADLMSWGAIGARTTESQVHRVLASGLACPIGFKNGTVGNTDIAINAIKVAKHSHHCLSVTETGRSTIARTAGNHDCHIILRGGKKPNYDFESVNQVAKQLKRSNLNSKIMIDCSHDNSNKNYKLQLSVCENICKQIEKGNSSIFGLMVESFLVEGKQDMINTKSLKFGQSVTDACIGWEDTKHLLGDLAHSVSTIQIREKCFAD